MTQTSDLSFDVILIGAGLVGGAFACALAQKGLRVGLVDAANPQGTLPEDPRTTALSYGSSKILEDLGLWESLDAQAQPIRQIRISQHNSYQVLHYRAEDVGGRPLGFMVKNTDLRQSVAQKVAAQGLIHLFAPDTVEDLTVFPKRTHVTLASGVLLKAPLVVAADGARSPLRKKLGIPEIRQSYGQKALIFNITHTNSHQDTAFEHFLPSGPLALLPFPNNESAIVWSDQTERIDALLALEEKQAQKHVLEAFQTRFGFGLGRLTVTSPLMAYPLYIVLPHTPIHNRVAFIGDAAHVIHPVSAQGLNLGLRDSQTLAHLVWENAALGLDLGSSTLLDTYAKARRPDVLFTMCLTHSFIRLFAFDHPLAASLRGMGLKIIDKAGPLKKKLLAQTMGMGMGMGINFS